MQDSHYFDRCNAFVEFTPWHKDEVRSYVKKVFQAPLTEELFDEIYFEPIRDKNARFVGISDRPRKNIRQVVKQLRQTESREQRRLREPQAEEGEA